jgi:hypothetical protein
VQSIINGLVKNIPGTFRRISVQALPSLERLIEEQDVLDMDNGAEA